LQPCNANASQEAEQKEEATPLGKAAQAPAQAAPDVPDRYPCKT